MPPDNKKQRPSKPTRKNPDKDNDIIGYIVPSRGPINKRNKVAPVQPIPAPPPKPKR